MIFVTLKNNKKNHLNLLYFNCCQIECLVLINFEDLIVVINFERFFVFVNFEHLVVVEYKCFVRAKFEHFVVGENSCVRLISNHCEQLRYLRF